MVKWKIQYRQYAIWFDLINLNKNSKENIYNIGQEFHIDYDLGFYIIISTHTNLNAIISFYEAKNLGRSELFKYSDLRSEDTLELF